jgi:hypothetical protein
VKPLAAQGIFRHLRNDIDWVVGKLYENVADWFVSVQVEFAGCGKGMAKA